MENEELVKKELSDFKISVNTRIEDLGNHVNNRFDDLKDVLERTYEVTEKAFNEARGSHKESLQTNGKVASVIKELSVVKETQGIYITKHYELSERVRDMDIKYSKIHSTCLVHDKDFIENIKAVKSTVKVGKWVMSDNKRLGLFALSIIIGVKAINYIDLSAIFEWSKVIIKNVIK